MPSQRFTVPLLDHLTEGDAAAVEVTLRAVPGVLHVYVSRPTEMAYVATDDTLTESTLLMGALEALGLGAGPPARR